jgi:hypothetical protein
MTKAVGIRKLRRGISLNWRCLGWEDEREMEEEATGYL